MTTLATIIAIDPSLTRTGWAVLEAPQDTTGDRLRLVGGDRRILAYGSGAARREGSLRHVWLELASHVPIDRPWVACVEMYPPPRRGEGSAPIAADAVCLGTWVARCVGGVGAVVVAHGRTAKVEPLRLVA